MGDPYRPNPDGLDSAYMRALAGDWDEQYFRQRNPDIASLINAWDRGDQSGGVSTGYFYFMAHTGEFTAGLRPFRTGTEAARGVDPYPGMYYTPPASQPPADTTTSPGPPLSGNGGTTPVESGSTTPGPGGGAASGGITGLPIVGPLIGSLSTSTGMSPTIILLVGGLAVAYLAGAFEGGSKRR
jgi:hypothetical protein